MKKLALLIGLLLCAGCTNPGRETEAAREQCRKLAGLPGSFSVSVTAEYPDIREQFSMDCRWDPAGSLEFELTGPQTLAGIRGSVTQTDAQVRFDDTVLALPLLDGDRLSPAAGPQLVMQAMRSGQFLSSVREDGRLHVSFGCGYEASAPTAEIWLTDGKPTEAELSLGGRRCLLLEIRSYETDSGG